LPLRTVVLATVLALLASIATVVLLSGDDDATEPQIPVTLEPDGGTTQDPSDVLFTTFDDEEVSLDTLRGSPVVLNFFASTCAPCITEMPALEEVHAQFGDRVEFLGLAVFDRPEAAQRLVEQTGVTYPTAQDKDGSAIEAMGGTMLPTTVLLDADGKIVRTHTGEISADELRDLLADDLGITA
jgi:thiol-disulfide isomerase/thioredoxin